MTYIYDAFYLAWSNTCQTFDGYIFQFYDRDKGRDLTQSYDKSPYTDKKIKKATWRHKNAPKNFDYTKIADRLRR